MLGYLCPFGGAGGFIIQGGFENGLRVAAMEKTEDPGLIRRLSTRSTLASQGDIFDREDFNSVDFINKLFPTGKGCGLGDSVNECVVGGDVVDWGVNGIAMALGAWAPSENSGYALKDGDEGLHL